MVIQPGLGYLVGRLIVPLAGEDWVSRLIVVLGAIVSVWALYELFEPIGTRSPI